LEAACSWDLTIFHFFFGTPGACNDINVLCKSPLLEKFMSGNIPALDYSLNGTKRSMPYLLADGIYPDYPVFVKSYSQPPDEKTVRLNLISLDTIILKLNRLKSYFTKAQEALRKDIERAFGVLQARWHILARPSRFWTANRMAIVIEACIILHNMIIKDEGPPSLDMSVLDIACPPGALDDPFFAETSAESLFGRVDSVDSLYSHLQVKDRVEHNLLVKDLVEHLWEVRGNRSV
jgi:hypothetical protein